jgi:hypothetical protein
VSFEEVTLRFCGLLVLFSLLGRFENLVCKTLQSITVTSLVFPLRVEDVDSVKEIFELTWPGPVLGSTAPRLLHIGHRAVRLPFLVVAFGCVGPI